MIGRERLVQRKVQHPGKGESVEERHVRALAKLGAGAVGGVADVDQAGAVGPAQRAMAVAGGGELALVGDVVEEGAMAGQKVATSVFQLSRGFSGQSSNSALESDQKTAALGVGSSGRQPMGRMPAMREARW